MQVIGITGGAGSGKSAVLKEIEKRYGDRVRVLRADDIANEVKEPGGLCYNKIVSVLGTDILEADGTINRRRMAERIFTDDALLQEVNAILHPAVRKVLRDTIRSLREEESGHSADAREDAAARQVPRVLFIEAALLIEARYREEMLDELWVVHAPADIRRRRLKETRGYMEERIDGIFAAQQTDESFLAHADAVIENTKTIEDALRQADELLRGMV